MKMIGLAKKLVLVSGIINLGLALFHLSFWRIFDWGVELSRVSPDNSAVMQVLNLTIVFILLAAAYLALFRRTEILSTRLGRTLLAVWSVFWLVRAVNQVVFWGAGLASLVMALVFMLLFVINIVPAFGGKEELSHAK